MEFQKKLLITGGKKEDKLVVQLVEPKASIKFLSRPASQRLSPSNPVVNSGVESKEPVRVLSQPGH